MSTEHSEDDPKRLRQPEPHQRPNPAAGIGYDLFLRCVHCGLCTSSCPTFTEVGDENDGPRGRIQLMRMVADGRTGLTDRMRRHLELCVDCRACETACPSGRRVWPADRAVPPGHPGRPTGGRRSDTTGSAS